MKRRNKTAMNKKILGLLLGLAMLIFVGPALSDNVYEDTLTCVICHLAIMLSEELISGT